MNKTKQDTEEVTSKTSRFQDPLKQKEKPHLRSLHGRAYYSGAVFMVCVALASLFLALAFNEKDEKTETVLAVQQKNQILTDPETVSEIKSYTEFKEPLEVFDFKYDAMDRGNHEYAAYPLLIDPLAYEKKEISRGDVVLYEYEFFDGKKKTVSRVIGLPGETIEIKEGQLYIDEKKLETFYGKAHRLGISSNEEYNDALRAQGSTENIDAMKEIFSQSTEKFRLADDEIFLVGDDWFRGIQHTLSISEIDGEVLGYIK